MKKLITALLGVLIVGGAIAAVAINRAKPASQPTSPSPITTLKSFEELQKVLDSSENELLVFDLYADWCTPCKILSPMLEKIAQSESSRATFYKINVDANPQIAAAFGVEGIPFVVFVKNKAAVSALTGVQPKEAYLQIIKQHS
jgi:thioredoxin 1